MKKIIFVAFSLLVLAESVQAREVDQLRCNEQVHRYIHFTLQEGVVEWSGYLTDGYTHARYVCSRFSLENIAGKPVKCVGLFMNIDRPAKAQIFKNQRGKIQALVTRFYGGTALLDCKLKKVKVN